MLGSLVTRHRLVCVAPTTNVHLNYIEQFLVASYLHHFSFSCRFFLSRFSCSLLASSSRFFLRVTHMYGTSLVVAYGVGFSSAADR